MRNQQQEVKFFSQAVERLIKAGKLLTSCFHSNTILLVPAVFPIHIGTARSFVGTLHTIELDKMSQTFSCKCTELAAAHDLGAMPYWVISW